MKNVYQRLSMAMVIALAMVLPFDSMAQDLAVKKVRANAAPCYKYWSVGAFGGLMQFNGDLSKNLLANLYSKSVGYNFGVVAAKQFSRVIGIRIRLAYGHIQGNVEDKWVWDYKEGNGVAQKITQNFRTSLFESDLQLTVNWLNWILGYKPQRILSSYLFAGVGVDHASGTRYDVNEVAIAYLGKNGDPLSVGNTSGIGGDNLAFKVSAGLGFDINLSKHFSVPVEFAWRWQNSDNLDMTQGGSQVIVNDMYSSATVGITYKFGYSCPKPLEPIVVVVPPAVAALSPDVRFAIIAPRNIPVERTVKEIFPLRNYIFFEPGSTLIPDRYVLLSKDQVAAFKEDKLEMYPPKNLSGRSSRQMLVYYNVLNILGDRMGTNPSTTITLIGASMQGVAEGRAMAESVKNYLVSVFGIDGARINIDGRLKPRVSSEQPGGTKELDLLREDDNRVTIWSTSTSLLMEFQTGEAVPLRPVEIMSVHGTPIDSYVYVNVAGAAEAFTSWSLEIMDENGTIQNYGPYTNEYVSMPGKTVLGVRPMGTYKVTMVGMGKNGITTRKDTTVNMTLWTPAQNTETTRFSILYEFNESNAIKLYEKYLTDIVIPRIPQGGKVIIHGYTDIIGDEAYNQKLSLERANDVRNILANGLSNAGRNDAKFEVYGFGEDQLLSPFENRYPEERFYNRTVIIDIIPKE
jgi:outer membrane protein OmpA-like peptidoglycan-associated protein/opacity protein-like surface antigen